jgi:nitroreductase
MTYASNDNGKYISFSFSDCEKRRTIQSHFSKHDVRSHFISGRDIPNEVLARILNAAHHAPSVGFSQPWNFILIKDKAIREQVKESFLRERKRKHKSNKQVNKNAAKEEIKDDNTISLNSIDSSGYCI